jgi:hypothetical protein
MSEELSKEELARIKSVARDMSMAMTEAMMNVSRDKRVCVMASMKVAAGMARGANMDMHRAIHLFMTFYKDADEHFKSKGA